MLSIWAYNYDWGGAPPIVITPPDGGITEREYKKYRKHLENMIRAADQREYQEYNKSAKIIEKIAEKANIEVTKPVAIVSETKKIEYTLPDYSGSVLALNQLLEYIIIQRNERIAREMALDDDILMMVLMA